MAERIFCSITLWPSLKRSSGRVSGEERLAAMQDPDPPGFG
jgi:hypothetical protein